MSHIAFPIHFLAHYFNIKEIGLKEKNEKNYIFLDISNKFLEK